MSHFLETQQHVMTSFLEGEDEAPSLPDLVPSANGQKDHAEEAPRSEHKIKRKAEHVEANGTPDTPSAAKAETVEPPLPAPSRLAPTPLAAAPAEQPAPDRAWLTNRFVDLVSQQTGYPKDMLGLDIDLEADLGIDSIKRVEILAKMADALGATDALSGNLEMEKLTVMKTLRGIIDHLDSSLNPAQSGATAVPATNGHREVTQNGQAPTADADAEPIGIQRGLVAPADAPLPLQPSFCLANGTVLFTDDGRGIAWEMAAGWPTWARRPPWCGMARAGEKPAEGYAADLTDPRRWRSCSPECAARWGRSAASSTCSRLAEPPDGEERAEQRPPRSQIALPAGPGAGGPT